ncbi:hypothetical protein Tco_1044007 [Tanacetum coccineum]|uniref:Uncharacterized protein n=1 Tax=Tanacetum coccineum TaxID=301880 RepID=A0ABQ5GNQ7_9ASTR
MAPCTDNQGQCLVKSDRQQACSFMLCDLDFEPLTLSLTSMPSCDLESLTNIYANLKASNQMFGKSFNYNYCHDGAVLGLLEIICLEPALKLDGSVAVVVEFESERFLIRIHFDEERAKLMCFQHGHYHEDRCLDCCDSNVF